MINTSGVVKRVRLGDDVLTHCGKCKEERTHQVVALNASGGIERVICRTCNGNHLYRDRDRQSKVKTGTAKKPRQPKAAASIPHDAPLHDYSPKEVYARGQLILHPKFGAGEVVEARGGKIDVRFNREIRTLLHAG